MALSGKSFLLTCLIGLLLLGTVLALLYGDGFSSPDTLANHLRATGLWAPLIVVLLMILHSFVPFPAEILALCAGAVFGPLLGGALIWSGAMAGALVAFGLARWLGRTFVQRWLSAAQTRRIDEWTDKRGAFTLVLLRFMPVIAFNLINYAAGLTRVPVWTFVWTTAIGIVPITFLCSWLGAHMRTLEWPMVLMLSAIGILGLSLLHWVARTRQWI